MIPSRSVSLWRAGLVGLLAAAGAGAVLSSASGCGASSSASEDGAFVTPPPSGSARLPPVPVGDSDAGATTTPQPGEGNTALVIVNASRKIPAFRICKDADVVLASNSERIPFPTTRMPGSSLAGVDVNGAVRVDPSSRSVLDVANAASVVILFIDAATKVNPALEDGSCKVLACSGGTPCLGLSKLRRVPVRATPGMNAFAAGNMLVLRDDGDASDAAHFDVLPLPDGGIFGGGRSAFYLSNFSDSSAPVTFTRGGTTTALDTSRPLIFDSSDLSGELGFGGQRLTLSGLHVGSEPGTEIGRFYSGQTSLFLLGLSAPSPGDEARALTLVAVPHAAPEAPPQDAGAR